MLQLSQRHAYYNPPPTSAAVRPPPPSASTIVETGAERRASTSPAPFVKPNAVNPNVATLAVDLPAPTLAAPPPLPHRNAEAGPSRLRAQPLATSVASTSALRQMAAQPYGTSSPSPSFSLPDPFPAYPPDASPSLVSSHHILPRPSPSKRLFPLLYQQHYRPLPVPDSSQNRRLPVRLLLLLLAHLRPASSLTHPPLIPYQTSGPHSNRPLDVRSLWCSVRPPSHDLLPLCYLTSLTY